MKKYDVMYDYKEGNKYWLVYGDSTSAKAMAFGPEERCFDSKKELNEFKKSLLVEETKEVEVKVEENETSLLSLKREELIGMMKERHIKGWYRIYNKEDMVKALLG